jgi:hypothetical protein
VFLCQPALITLALSVNFSDGAAGDSEDSFFSTADADHQPGFLLRGDEVFPALPRLLDLDAVSLWSSPESHHQVAYGEELVIRL